MAAGRPPLDDKRLVSFLNPQLRESLPSKIGPTMPPDKAAMLERLVTDPASDPQAQWQAALEQARHPRRLLER
ncbi:hypothetical protein DFAR_2870038 [Desulfarculales bacterium]